MAWFYRNGIIADQCEPGSFPRQPVTTSWRHNNKEKTMKKFAAMLGLLMMTGMMAVPVFAQDAAAGKPPASVSAAMMIAAGLAMGIAAGLCGIGQGRVGAAACEGIARNPGAAGPIRLAMILGLVFIETLVLFTLAVVFAKMVY
jgi:F-type H+-transporting ATPase subunit c